MLRPLLGADIEPVLLMDQAVGNIRIDPTQLEQVLMNLSINARDAMPGGGKLIIRAVNTTVAVGNIPSDTTLTPGDYVILSVADTGTGMPPEVRSQIFEPFFTTKPSGKGTGLGLATCYGIVKSVGGDISLETAPGIGTTFNVYFPRAESSVEERQTERPTSPVGGSETVLVVEDEPLVRELSVNALRRNGYTVFEAENGTHALEVLEANGGKVHLLITDAVMPLMGGKDLIERVRVAYPEIKLILASGYSESGMSFQPALPVGVTFLQKPFSSAILLTTVREVITGSAAD